MTSETLSLQNLRYNPEFGAFEALARIAIDGVIFARRVHLKAPPHAEFSRVTRGLADRARRAHRSLSNAGGVRSARRAAPLPRAA